MTDISDVDALKDFQVQVTVFVKATDARAALLDVQTTFLEDTEIEFQIDEGAATEVEPV